MILQLICPDRSALVRELAGWVAANGGNIRHADHHTDAGAGLFLSRIEWGLEGFGLPREAIAPSAAALAQRLDGEAQLHFSDEHPRVAILASKQSHCLLDLLREHDVELAVLAKYMQVLSGDFLEQFPTVINIHHSFLPAFKGAQPYHRAWERGVKLIGATAHYVTEDLDAGPIIEQTIAHVSHRDEVEDLIRKGRDTERLALARALRLHLRRQVMVYRGRTAVFA